MSKNKNRQFAKATGKLNNGEVSHRNMVRSFEERLIQSICKRMGNFCSTVNYHYYTVETGATLNHASGNQTIHMAEAGNTPQEGAAMVPVQPMAAPTATDCPMAQGSPNPSAAPMAAGSSKSLSAPMAQGSPNPLVAPMVADNPPVTTATPEVVADSDEPSCDTIIKRVILMLMELKKKGEYLFYSKSHWVSIFRILVDYYGFPQSINQFCQRIQQMGDDFRIPCTYNALSRIDGILGKSFSKWDMKECDSDRLSYFAVKLEIATTFKAMLKQEFGN